VPGDNATDFQHANKAAITGFYALGW